jgi:aspartokinase/homoserine dehydrogenase 1
MKTLDLPEPKLAPARPTAVRTVAHKFGGSSLADATRIRHVAALLRARDDATQVAVVSAMQGVTDALIALTATAVARGSWRPHWDALRERHRAVAAELLGDKADDIDAWCSASTNWPRCCTRSACSAAPGATSPT